MEKPNKSKKETMILPVQGIHCAACVNRVEKALKSVSGVIEAPVNLSSGKVTLILDRPVPFETLREAVKSAGDYKVLEAETTHETLEFIKAAELKSLKTQLISGIAGSVLVMAGSMKNMIGLGFLPDIPVKYTLFLIASAVMIFAGRPFFAGAWNSLKRGTSDMNTLVAVGTGSAYLYSVTATFLPGWLLSGGVQPHLYYDTSVMIITFILLGRYLEMRAKAKTSRAVHELMDLTPKTALRITGSGEEEIELEDVQPGDILRVKPGQSVPVDGTITEGRGILDESMITGESMPVSRAAGDEVVGGTLNTTGLFTFRADKIGSDTVLSRIIRMVEIAQGSRAPIQRLADRIAAVFVPSVIGIALATFAIWFFLGPPPQITRALLQFIAVMIIACPCALGLATPTAIMVGTGIGAKHGIFIKGGETLERLHNIHTIVFDKTGTLTRGEPALVNVEAVNDIDEESLLRWSASAESGSEHPLALPIIDAASQRSLKLLSIDSFNAIPGRGIEAVIHGEKVFLGSAAFIESSGIDISALRTTAESWAAEGKTVILAARSGKLAGGFAIADTLRPESCEAVKKLHDLGIETVMLTGDNEATARGIAAGAGIEHVIAEVLPDQKAAHIKRLQENGKIVAMVGDGINDAPALAQADIGISIDSGTDVAIETADITLMRGDLRKAWQAVVLSRKTMRTIRQNLFWAFIYNIIGIPIAAGALYPFFGILLKPVFAALAMSFSSVSVVSNSLRLRRVKL